MSSLPENFENLKHTTAEFLLIDLESALTFLEVAATSSNAETVARNHRNARKAYDTVLNFLSKLTLTAPDRLAVETKLTVVKGRLIAVGQQF